MTCNMQHMVFDQRIELSTGGGAWCQRGPPSFISLCRYIRALFGDPAFAEASAMRWIQTCGPSLPQHCSTCTRTLKTQRGMDHGVSSACPALERYCTDHMLQSQNAER